jgi:hypothetical protein
MQLEPKIKYVKHKKISDENFTETFTGVHGSSKSKKRITTTNDSISIPSKCSEHWIRGVAAPPKPDNPPVFDKPKSGKKSSKRKRDIVNEL